MIAGWFSRWSIACRTYSWAITLLKWSVVSLKLIWPPNQPQLGPPNTSMPWLLRPLAWLSWEESRPATSSEPLCSALYSEVIEV